MDAVGEPVSIETSAEKGADATHPSPPRRPRALGRRRELFCRHYVACGVGAKAARLAGYKPSSAANHAFRLLARADVRARIGELRSDIVALEAADVIDCLAKVEAAYERSMIDGRVAAAVRAIALQAKLLGLDSPRRPERRPARVALSRDVAAPAYVDDPRLDPDARARVRRDWRRGVDTVAWDPDPAAFEMHYGLAPETDSGAAAKMPMPGGEKDDICR